MRVLRKRIEIANQDNGSNSLRAEQARARYGDKMSAKGWFHFENLNHKNCAISEGNCFFKYETYFDVYKPSLNSQKDLDSIAKMDHEDVLEMLASDIKNGKITGDGVRVLNELRKRGWNNVSYSRSAKSSKYTVRCGYDGGYQQSILIKEFH